MIKLRHPAHWLAGGITGWIGQTNPVLAFGLIVVFLAYELWQDYRTQDRSYWDILEFVIAAYMVVTGLYIWRMF